MKQVLFGTRKRVLVSIAAFMALVVIASAAAAWLISSQGGAKAQGGTLVAPTVTPATDAPATKCFPGSPCPVAIRVNNPNGALVLTGIAPGTDSTQNSPGNAEPCPHHRLTVNSVTGLSIAIPAGITDNIVVPGGATLASDAPTECQGQIFTKAVRGDFATP